MQELGLSEAADTIVGGAGRKGISGVLVLDEVTTGLDSFTSFQLLETLSRLAARGQTIVLSILWAELAVASSMGQGSTCRRIATYVLSMPRSSRSPPLLPIFLHITLPSHIAAADHLMTTEQGMAVELMVGVISSALTAALYVEWALLSVCKEKRLVLGQTALAMARRLSGDLRRKAQSPVSASIVQRLTSNSQFMANFPTFAGDL
ncbi:hypothetical protein NM688_g3501 [Phlebia brevispora]|uniref:Uncharacterized protein n=1 Tax=Phlebia brevispora TaxID=194682 RepID=A0ACC1T5I2_9APHY|nr:hypothetical protein NM688_g3501 [Phlebia brevispora]